MMAQRLSAPLTDPAQIPRGSMRSRPLPPTRRRAPKPVRVCRRRPISPARCRGWRSAAAARATLPPSAMASWRRPTSPARSAHSGGAGGNRRSRADVPPPRRHAGGRLAAALAAELPAFKRDGGFVREGYESSLDEARALRDESRRVIAALQARYIEETGVRILKIKHNNVLGTSSRSRRSTANG